MARWTVHGLQRGAKEALQGIRLVLVNPHLRQQKFLRIFIHLAVLSVVLLVITHLLVTIPLRFAKALVFVFASGDTTRVDQLLESTRSAIRDLVSYVPVVALLFMRYAYRKPLDDLFMETIRYIDETNKTTYTAALSQHADDKKIHTNNKKKVWPSIKVYLLRTWKKVRLGLVVFLLSLLPVVGQFVFPLAGAYTTWKSLGNTQGVAVGISFFFLPRWATLILVRSLIGMRTLMRELLEPYFARMHFSHKEKLKWFSGRKDVLFGFSAIAYLLIRVPFVGFVGYGVAQAAAAYMLTTVVSVEEVVKHSPDGDGEKSKVGSKLD
ncbi:hypothetical protein [Absidia glauca]|uniref:Transmembrane protein UsgS n=1 Tax=Absidia glauca TaxID=4829 RepID=A0A168QD48_ABSGL|nr:hypothetical protein [Absidia glauca]